MHGPIANHSQIAGVTTAMGGTGGMGGIGGAGAATRHDPAKDSVPKMLQPNMIHFFRINRGFLVSVIHMSW
jgi:hypothetical protein